MAKLVFHVDVNSAYLSWEAARRVAKGEPDIRNIPAVIGGDRALPLRCKKYPHRRPGHRAMLDVQITGANTRQRHPDNGIPVIHNYRLGLVQQGKSSAFDVSQGFHRRHLR